MWKTSTGSGIKVAVVDTGVNANTSSLKGQVLSEDIPSGAAYGATKDYDGHGTTMAELIAGTGRGGGLKGLAPEAKIIPFRVVLSTLKDPAEKELSQQPAAAIRAAADSDAKIISMSFGAPTTDQATKDAVKYAAAKGKLMFAGAGNDEEKHEGFVAFPAALPEVVGIGAADANGNAAKFSQSGDYLDLASPGLNVPGWCDATFQKYCDSGGTSAATALTSASAALIWSAHPAWTANQVLRVMIDTAARNWDKSTPSKYFGYGLIRPRLVLEQRDINPGPPDVDPLSGDSVAGGAAASGRPGSGAAKGPAPQDPAPKAAADAKPVGGSGQLWGAVGIGAGVLVIGGGALAVLRARRRRT
ncbi:S8 family serine peptidase [Streptomyces sp. NPDC051993]|uniref:S8 family serine peptidase n=1 Tax=Streptomyces sp. NPDC051993 TaxID=3155286 RepID=UPI00343F6FF3